MRSKPFTIAALFLGVIFVLPPLYSLARDKHEDREERESRYAYEDREEDDDDRYEYAAVPEVAAPIATPQNTFVFDATERQINEYNAALEARRRQLEQQRAEQQRFADQLSGIEQQLAAQRNTLDAKVKDLAQRKTEQDEISRQLDALERQLSSETQGYTVHYPTDGSVAYTVTDSNFNGISDILEGLAQIALR